MGAGPESVAGAEGQVVDAAEVVELSEEFAFGGELLNAGVFAVGDVEGAGLVEEKGVGEVELAGGWAGGAPLVEEFAVRGELEDAGVAVAVGDEQMAGGGEGDVCGACERLGT